MAHDVTINEDAVSSVFDEFEAVPDSEAPRAPGGAVALAEPTPSQWAAMAKMAAEILANQVCPNWEVPPETRQEWADALAACLDQLFPGGLGNIANWGPWAKLAYVSVMWGMCGIDYKTMRMKPLREPIEGEAEETGHQDAPARAPEPAQSNGPHYMG